MGYTSDKELRPLVLEHQQTNVMPERMVAILYQMADGIRFRFARRIHIEDYRQVCMMLYLAKYSKVRADKSPFNYITTLFVNTAKQIHRSGRTDFIRQIGTDDDAVAKKCLEGGTRSADLRSLVVYDDADEPEPEEDTREYPPVPFPHEANKAVWAQAKAAARLQASAVTAEEQAKAAARLQAKAEIAAARRAANLQRAAARQAAKEQREAARRVVYRGRTYADLRALADSAGVQYMTARSRLQNKGTIHRAFSAEWLAKRAGCSTRSMQKRLAKHKGDVVKAMARQTWTNPRKDKGRQLQWNGASHSIPQLAVLAGVTRARMYARLYEANWDVAKAMADRPPNPGRTPWRLIEWRGRQWPVKALAAEVGLTEGALWGRLRWHKGDVERALASRVRHTTNQSAPSEIKVADACGTVNGKPKSPSTQFGPPKMT